MTGILVPDPEGVQEAVPGGLHLGTRELLPASVRFTEPDTQYCKGDD